MEVLNPVILLPYIHIIDNDIEVFPTLNHKGGKVSIKLIGIEYKWLNVTYYDLSCKKVYSESVNDFFGDILEITPQPLLVPGNYILELNTGYSSFKRPLIIINR